MSRIVIKGHNRLYGSVTLSGSKNAILPIMAATLLCKGTTRLYNCPDIADVTEMQNILKYLGCTVKRINDSIQINTDNAVNRIIPGSISKKLRASSILMGPLLARFYSVKIAPPGGCDIGSRPLDIHLNAFKRFGGAWTVSEELITVEGRMHSSDIVLRFPSVGATENSIMAAVFLSGETVIYNAAKEPDIVMFCEFLVNAGADIKGAGTDTISIRGVDKLNGTDYIVGTDRIVAGTYMAAVTACGGNVKIDGCYMKDLQGFVDVYSGMGTKINNTEKGIEISIDKRPYNVNCIRTEPFPGFPTDMQSITLSAASIAKGDLMIYENMYENRFKVVDELIKMGANITVSGKWAYVSGVERMYGTTVYAKDLRGGAALVIAGLCAEGETIVENADYIMRGYTHLCENLRKLGADIRWESN